MRVIRACRDMGLASVAVYSDVRSRRAPRADGRRGGGDRRRARRARATCASTADRRRATRRAPTPCIRATASSPRTQAFAAACRDAGLTFIGPSPEAIALMGSKTARAPGGRSPPACRSSRAPRSRSAPTLSDAEIATAARRASATPIMVKAVAGGGGKGMRVVGGAGRSARRRSRRAIGSGRGVRRLRDLPRAAADRARATSRCSCSPTSTAPCCRSSSASARSSGGIRR